MEEKEHKTVINNNLMREDGVHVEEKEGDIVNLVQQSVQQEDSQCREIKKKNVGPAAGGRKGLKEDGSIGGNNKSLVESLAIVEDIEDTQSATGAKGGNGEPIEGMEDDEEDLEDISDVIFHEQQDGSSVFHV